MSPRAHWTLPLLLLVFAHTAHAQAPRRSQPRVWIAAWGATFTNMGGFSDGTTFNSFDGTYALGASLHVSTGAGILLGIDALYTQPDYTQFDRETRDELARDQATVMGAVVSARLASGGGPLGIYLGGGAGIFSWDLPDLEEKKVDPALTVGIGAEYALRARLGLFAQYDQWWVYHEKDEMVQSNTANHSLLRVGARLGLL